MGKFKQVITGPLVATMAVNFMGGFQMGYNIGSGNNIQDVVEEFMNVTIQKREGEEPSEDLVTNLWAVIVAIFYLGGAVGTLVYRWLSQRTGRKHGLLLNTVLGIVASGLMFAARRAERWELLLVGRLLIGIHAGISTGLVPVYLAEISPKEIRGAVSNLNPLGISIAVFVGQVLGFPDILGTHDLWDVLVGLAVVPCAIQLLLLPFCVESPRYLMISQRDVNAATRALKRLRKFKNVEDELKVMQKEMEHVTDSVTLMELLRNPPTRRALGIATVVHMALHFSGLNGVLFYSNNLFQESIGLSSTDAAYVTSSLGILAIITAVLATPLSEVAGRRILELFGLIGVSVDLMLVTICLIVRHEVEGFGIVAIVFLLAFMVFFNIGPGCVPWIVMGEVFPQNARPIGSAIAVGMDWVCGFIVAYAFSPLEKALKDYVFIPFCVLTTLATIYTYFNLPRTKGKTIEEIIASFRRPGDKGASLRTFEKLAAVESSGTVSRGNGIKTLESTKL